MRRHSGNSHAIAVLILFLGCIGPTGCGKSPTPSPGAGGGDVTWLNFREINPAAGLDWAEASYGIDKRGLVFLILGDVVGTSSIASKGGDGRPSVYEGTCEALDGCRVTWACETADGKTGTMKINGKVYELGDGPLFLIATRGAEVRVRQLARDLSAVRPEKESLEEFLRHDPDIGPFFAEAAVAK
jgi:hypothetical protein